MGLPGDVVGVVLRCVARPCGRHNAAAGGIILRWVAVGGGAAGCACSGGLVVDLCAAIPSRRSAMLVNLECTRLPRFGRLELPMGAPIGRCCCFGFAAGAVLRSWRCSSVVAWICCRRLCASRGVLCSWFCQSQPVVVLGGSGGCCCCCCCCSCCCGGSGGGGGGGGGSGGDAFCELAGGMWMSAPLVTAFAACCMFCPCVVCISRRLFGCLVVGPL